MGSRFGLLFIVSVASLFVDLRHSLGATAECSSLLAEPRQQIKLRHPEKKDGPSIWALIKASHERGELDLNSPYCYVKQCVYHSEATVVAERNGQIVGYGSSAISSGPPPHYQSTLFLWQIVLDPSVRTAGVAHEMTMKLVENGLRHRVKFIEATTTAENKAVRALLRAVAVKLNANYLEVPEFLPSEGFPKEAGQHPTEDLIRIGPLKNIDWLYKTEWPSIQTSLPGPKASAILTLQRKYESSAVSYPGLHPLVPDSAHGSLIRDVDGNVFIDLFGMAGAMVLGHTPFQPTDAFVETAKQIHSTLDFPTPMRVDFLKELHRQIYESLKLNTKIHLTGPTGTDAVESALKLARYKTQGEVIIAFEGSYHGMTAGSSAVTDFENPATWQFPKQSTVFLPYPICRNCQSPSEIHEFRDKYLIRLDEALRQIERTGRKIAAAIIEPIQGEGGVNIPDRELLHSLHLKLKSVGGLLIADEVQTGFGRTGYLFASEGIGLQPDILVFSKAVSGVGAPLAGIAFSATLDGWPRGSSIGTFRGNNPALASGIEVLNYLADAKNLRQVQQKGDRVLKLLRQRLKDNPIVSDIRGQGYMIGIEICKHNVLTVPSPERAKAIAQDAFRAGAIVEIGGRANNVLRLLPALNISDDLFELGIEIVISAIEAQTDVD